jgi:hypothetical protein
MRFVNRGPFNMHASKARRGATSSRALDRSSLGAYMLQRGVDRGTGNGHADALQKPLFERSNRIAQQLASRRNGNKGKKMECLNHSISSLRNVRCASRRLGLRPIPASPAAHQIPLFGSFAYLSWQPSWEGGGLTTAAQTTTLT